MAFCISFLYCLFGSYTALAILLTYSFIIAFGYRKEVVMSNIALAFPEKSLAERKLIAKKFYKNFIDNFIEIIKLLSISKKQLQKRFVGESDNVNKYYSTGKKYTIAFRSFF